MRLPIATRQARSALFATVGLASVTPLALIEDHGLNQVDLQLAVKVVDVATYQPVDLAVVHLAGEPQSAPRRADPEGLTTHPIRVPSVTRRSLLRSRHARRFDAWHLSVNAPGYQEFHVPLRMLTTDPAYHRADAPPPPVLVRLARAAP